MSASKHTPGPWYWNRNAGGPLEVCSEQDVHRCVARAHLCEADARLIAAAPRLLEAAKAALAVLETLHYTDAQRQLVAAIAEAEDPQTERHKA